MTNHEATILSAKEMGRVGVMMGGISGEREVSLESGANILASLLKSGVDAFSYDPKEASLGDLIRAKPDRVFMILHGQPGEDGRYQGVLDLHGIPYTGSGMLGSALTLNKKLSKEQWQKMNLPTPAFVLIDKQVDDTKADYEKTKADLSLLPNQYLVVKPSCEGSSLGITIVKSFKDWSGALINARQYRGEILAEEYIAGNEYTVAVIGDQPLPTVAIRYNTDFYDYAAKYLDEQTQLLCPCELAVAAHIKLKELALEAAKPLAIRGWYRADFIISDNMKPYLLEINTIPGMTSHSLVPKAAMVHGWDYEALVMRILSTATFDGVN